MLSAPGRQAAQTGGADQENGSDPWPCLHVVIGTAAILLPLVGLAMAFVRPGRWQRRHQLGCLAALLLWSLRWLWPFQLLPGWILALLFAWAGIESIALLRSPRRWR